jgi:hypothetical protein
LHRLAAPDVTDNPDVLGVNAINKVNKPDGDPKYSEGGKQKRSEEKSTARV